MTHVRLRLFLVSVVLLSPVSQAQSCSTQVWDAASDFSSTANPNGAWQYGWTTAIGFNPFLSQTAWGPGCGFPVWGDSNWLAIGKNSSSVVFCNCQARIPSQKLLMHPGFTGESAVLRWIAPAGGTYQVTGQIAGLELVFATTTVTLRRNATQLWTFNLSNNGPSSCNASAPIATTIPSTTLTLSVGDTIDCIVGNGGNGSGNDSTMVDLTISCLAPQTPEYQTNSVVAWFDINGVSGGTTTPAMVTVPGGQTATVNMSSLNGGQPWDVGVGTAALIPASAGALTSSTGQIVNLDLSDTTLTTWFNYLSGPLWGPSPSLSYPFSIPGPSMWSAQMIVVAPNSPSGIALSQPVRLIVL